MFRFQKSLAAAVLLMGALLGGCADSAGTPTASSAQMEISPATQGALQTYLGAVRHNPGAFAVSVDGNNSFMNYCPDRVCMNYFFGDTALRRCEGLSGQKCLLLFVGREPRVAFSVAADKGITGLHGKRVDVPRDMLFP